MFEELLRKINTRQNRYAIISTFCFGLIVHMYILVHNFVNHDGIYYFYIDKLDMTVSGRWFLDVATGLTGSFTMPWLIGIISLLYIAIGNALLICFFEINRLSSILCVVGLVVASPVATGTFLYMFTADAYFLAYALSVGAAFVIKKHRNFYSLLFGSIMLSFSLGIYQAYGQVTVILLVFDSIIILLQSDKTVEEWKKICRYVLALLFGGGMYAVILNIALKIKNVQIGSYQGINEVSDLSISKILRGIPQCYIETMEYYLNGELTANTKFVFLIFVCSIFLTCGLLIKMAVKTPRKINICLCVCAIFLIPVVLSPYSLVSDTTVNHLLMKMSWIIPWVFSVALFRKGRYKGVQGFCDTCRLCCAKLLGHCKYSLC